MQGRKEFRAGLAASIAVHLAVFAYLLRFSPEAVETIPEPVISVTMVPSSLAPVDPTAPQPSPTNQPVQQQQAPSTLQRQEPETAPTAPAPAPEVRHAPNIRPAPLPKADPLPAMKEASAFYAASLLARPENRSAREALKTLSPEERHEQICDTEAMEQLRRADPRLHPDRLIAYALQNTQVNGDRLYAPGAAFRSGHRWFRISFECTLDAKHNAVTAFRFTIGNLIPSSQWSDLQLER